MSRKVKPWYRASRGQWFATVENDKQVPLGVFGQDQFEAAKAALAALLKTQPIEAAPVPWPDRVEAFLAAKIARKLKPKTVADYRKHLALWLARFGTVPPNQLSKDAIEDHSHSFATWGANTRRNYLCTVEGFLKWCGLKLELAKPGRESAGAEMVIPEAVHWQAVGAAWGDLKHLLTFLWHTGCRPAEATGLAVEGVDWEAGTIRLREHKTRGKGRDRIVYLSPPAIEVLQRQRQTRPTGLLFRSKLGTRFRDKGLAQALWRISGHIGHHVTAYGYRHSYATRALAKGIPDTHVAALLGHGSTRMVHAHYSHVNQNAKLLKDAAEKVSRAE